MTSEICPVSFREPSILKTGMLHERVQVFIPFKQTKSLLMKLLVASQSRKVLMEWSSLVFMVPTSTSRSKEVPRVSKVLIEKSLGSLFSYLGLWSGAVTGGLEGGASTSSLSIVLGSSIVNTVNLFTGDRSALIASCVTQNPPLPGNQTLLMELHLSMLTNLQSTLPTVPR